MFPICKVTYAHSNFWLLGFYYLPSSGQPQNFEACSRSIFLRWMERRNVFINTRSFGFRNIWSHRTRRLDITPKSKWLTPALAIIIVVIPVTSVYKKWLLISQTETTKTMVTPMAERRRRSEEAEMKIKCFPESFNKLPLQSDECTSFVIDNGTWDTIYILPPSSYECLLFLPCFPLRLM